MRRLIERYRFPESFLNLPGASPECHSRELSNREVGTARFGSAAADPAAALLSGDLWDAIRPRETDHGALRRPVDVDELADTLLLERYPVRGRNAARHEHLKSIYYSLRPLVPDTLREQLQRLYLADWRSIPFPAWPVDVTVERIFKVRIAGFMKAHGLDAFPFIWFWPDGHQSCAIVTHDVEYHHGKQFCSALMDIDDSFGIKASFQIVPEQRYAVEPGFLEEIRSRGFEVNVQDLNHDGLLLQSENVFMERVAAINRYGKLYGAAGFRAAALYRNLKWWHALDFEYDMSVPNAAHLEPQRGGCCTVFPYFVGEMLELPSTTTQDYALLHYLRQCSLETWAHQIALIRQEHGLINILVHPDYVQETKVLQLYHRLLDHLNALRTAEGVWVTTPGQVNEWWRARNRLSLLQDGGDWSIQGAGCERARLAFARLDGDTIRYDVGAQESRHHSPAPIRCSPTDCDSSP